jgi:hypothetical protein
MEREVAMRWDRMMVGLLLAGLLSGCDVVRAGVFIATVPHYHGGEGRTPQFERNSDPAPVRVPPKVPPRVTPEDE